MKIEGAKTTWRLGKIFLFLWFGFWLLVGIVFFAIYGFKEPPPILYWMVSSSINIIFWISMTLFIATIVMLVETFFEIVDKHNKNKNEKEDTLSSNDNN